MTDIDTRFDAALKGLQRRWSDILVLVLIALVAAGFTAQFFVFRDTLNDTHSIVTEEIPRLERQVDRQERQIADFESVQDQAIGHIVRLCNLLEARGGDCGHIELKPERNP